MGLNIKSEEVDRLATEAARRYGETKTEAIRKALEERLERDEFSPEAKLARSKRLLETEIWPSIPAHERGQPPLTKQEVEDILGFGPDGV